MNLGVHLRVNLLDHSRSPVRSKPCPDTIKLCSIFTNIVNSPGEITLLFFNPRLHLFGDEMVLHFVSRICQCLKLPVPLQKRSLATLTDGGSFLELAREVDAYV